MLAEMQKKYWIIHPVATTRRILSQCVICRKRDKKSVSQQMAPLPPHRIPAGDRLEPFTTCAIDCAGPYFIKQGRGKIRLKRYILLFRCTMYGAVHLEPLSRMHTDSFLLALDRFLALFCRPNLIISDNGSNFVLAEIQKKYWICLLYTSPSPRDRG